MSKTLIPIVAIIVVVGGIVLLTKHKKEVPATTDDSSTITPAPSTPAKATTSVKKPKPVAATTPAPVQAEDTTPTPTTTPSATTYRPVTQLYTVHASDTTADLKTIEINKGDTLNLTFAVDPRNNYHGGLDFRSDVISTGTVLPGQSKMVSFVPEHSFSFTPYWPSSDIAKDYTIDIIVK